MVRPNNFDYFTTVNDGMFWAVFIMAPLMAITFYYALFVGDATISAIPEGYEPEEWEYDRNPITR